MLQTLEPEDMKAMAAAAQAGASVCTFAREEGCSESPWSLLWLSVHIRNETSAAFPVTGTSVLLNSTLGLAKLQ